MPPTRIAVLLHEHGSAFDSVPYLLPRLLELWTRQGVVVDMLRGPHRFVDADLLIPHLDLTVAPAPYRQLIARYPLVLNRHVVDISKSAISANLVNEDDEYDGPVIVKTDRNYGGLPEAMLTRETHPVSSMPRRMMRTAISALTRRRKDRTPWALVETIPPSDYPVFPSKAAVPPGVFANRNLVVEKFVPEMQDGQYCLRYYYFLGDREVNLLIKSPRPVIKAVRYTSFCEDAPVPQEIRDIRRRMGFDYGKLDYVLKDGRVVLYDANVTPARNLLETFHRAPQTAAHLAEGVWSLVARPALTTS